MSTFVSLGSRGPVTGVADNTQNNTGNWTVTFSPGMINVNLPYFEISHIVVNGAPNSGFSIFVDIIKWESCPNGQSNAWDPSVPIPLNPGNTVYFYYSNPDTDSNPPVVTIWLRYDQDIIPNKNAVYGVTNL